MAKLWIGNLPPDVDETELSDFLQKFGFPPFDEMLHVPGDGTRPAAQLSFSDLDAETLRRLQPRVHDTVWKDRRLNVQVPPPERPEPR